MGAMFGKSPAPPPVAPPAVMPSPALDDEAVKRAKKNQLAAAQQRNGRASTIFTDSAEDKLG